MTASNWEQTERDVAEFFSTHGWPGVERRGRGYEGRELIGMPGLAPEVKARRRMDLPAWLRQARRERGGGIPFVVHKPDGVRMGQSEIDIWPATFPLLEATYLLRAAGYGGPEPHFYEWLEASRGSNR